VDAAWTICPHCQLKHRPRAQSLCPRCGRTSAVAARAPTPAPIPRAAPALAAAVAAPPATVAASVAAASNVAPAAPARQQPVSLEQVRERLRAANPEAQMAPAASSTLAVVGVILLVNAVLHLFEFLFLPSVASNSALRPVMLAGTLVGVLLDTVLGVGFLQGKEHLRTVALVRLIVGMFVFGGISLYQAEVLSTLVVFAFSCGVLVLVWGKPSSTLAGVGVTAVLLAGAVEVLGFMKLASSQSLDERARMALRPDLEGRELTRDDTLIGNRRPYQLRVPSNGWFRHKPNSPGALDPSTDLWLSQPELNGHLMVAVRDNPGSLSAAREQALSELRTRCTDFQETDSAPVATEAKTLTFAARCTRAGQPLRFEVSLYPTGTTLLRVTAAAPDALFQRLNLPDATTTLRPD
jgi:hypothetical protein